MIVQGYASVFNVRDKHLDTISPVAFDKFVAETDLSKQLLPLTVAHEPPYVGFTTSLEIHERRGLWATFEIFKTHQPYVRDLFSSGRDIGLSIGFETTESASEWTKEGEERIVRGINLREISLVSHPSNPEAWATITERRSLFGIVKNRLWRMSRLASKNGDES